MAPRRFAVDIDLLGFSLLNAMLNPVSADPTGLGAGQAGRVWLNTTSGRLKYWTGTVAIDMLDRTNHSGTQLAATISDLASTVKAYRHDEFAPPAADVSWNSRKLTSLLSGTAAGDAVNKGQLDAVESLASSAASGVAYKSSVRAVDTVGVTQSGAQTIDGVALTAGQRYLRAVGSNLANGIWVVAAGAHTRATDADITGELAPGTQVGVTEGAVAASAGGNADSVWRLVSDAAITIGTTAQTWERLPGSGAITYLGGAGLTLTGSTFDVGQGAGITVGADTVGLDITVAARRKDAVIPASSSGMFAISGAVVTVNHALNNWGARATVRAYSSPASGYTAGQLVEVDDPASDANNTVITLPVAPAANAWHISMIG